MIKKEIKTLSEFKNPTPETRWCIHLDDGTHIDVTGDEQRNVTLLRLLGEGRVTTVTNGNIPNLRVQPIRGVEHLEVNTNIERTEEDRPKRNKLWGLIKSDFGEWNWLLFFTKMGLATITALLTVLVQYTVSGPIKMDDNKVIPFFMVSSYAILTTYTILSSVWVLWKSWILLPYITCWVKMVGFLIIFVLCETTVGLISSHKSEMIMNFIGKYGISERELKILKTIIKE